MLLFILFRYSKDRLDHSHIWEGFKLKIEAFFHKDTALDGIATVNAVGFVRIQLRIQEKTQLSNFSDIDLANNLVQCPIPILQNK